MSDVEVSVPGEAQILIDGQLYKIEIIAEAERINGPLGEYTEKLAREFYEAYRATFVSEAAGPDAWDAVPEADREVMIAFVSQLVNRFGMPIVIADALKAQQVKEI